MKKNYNFHSLQQIIECFRDQSSLSPSEIAEMLGKSRAIVHRYLSYMVEVGRLKKIGTSPHVLYALVSEQEGIDRTVSKGEPRIEISYSDRIMLDRYFLKFSPRGERL